MLKITTKKRRSKTVDGQLMVLATFVRHICSAHIRCVRWRMMGLVGWSSTLPPLPSLRSYTANTYRPHILCYEARPSSGSLRLGTHLKMPLKRWR